MLKQCITSGRLTIKALVLGLLAAGCGEPQSPGTKPADKQPPSALKVNQLDDNQPGKKTATVTLGGGCFWCVEAVFERIKGVESVVSGYAGGATPDPTYREVCEGTTGHAEVCQVHYDPDIISLETLLEVFWLCHDPTTLNQQGNDVGTQYRSIILFHDGTQQKTAETSIAKASAKFADKVVTQVEPLGKFYEAEADHQNYYSKHPNEPYCAVTIPPKLHKIENLDIYAPKPRRN